MADVSVNLKTRPTSYALSRGGEDAPTGEQKTPTVSTTSGDEPKGFREVVAERKAAEEKKAKTDDAVKKSGDASKANFIATQKIQLPATPSVTDAAVKKAADKEEDPSGKNWKDVKDSATAEKADEKEAKKAEKATEKEAKQAAKEAEKIEETRKEEDVKTAEKLEAQARLEEKRQAEELEKLQKESGRKKDDDDKKPAPAAAVSMTKQTTETAQAKSSSTPTPTSVTTSSSITDPRANVNTASRESVSRTAQETAAAPTGNVAASSAGTIQASQSAAVSSISAPAASSPSAASDSVQRAVSSGEAAVQKVIDSAAQSINDIVSQGETAVAGAADRMSYALESATRAKTSSEQEAALYSAEQAADAANEHVQATSDRAMEAAQRFDGIAQQTAEASRLNVERQVESDRTRKETLKLQKSEEKKADKQAEQKQENATGVKPNVFDRFAQGANRAFDAFAALALGAPRPASLPAQDTLFQGVFEQGSAGWSASSTATPTPWLQPTPLGAAAPANTRRARSA